MNKVVLITGATTGIGAEIARVFAAAGYIVAINCRTKESARSKGTAVLEECLKLGGMGDTFVADVSDYVQCDAMIKNITKKYGAIHVLVNNAGITRDSLLPRMKEEDFDAVIATNLKSVYNTCRLVTPQMIKQREGRIINMSSVVGIYGNAGQTNYAASKAGIIGFTKSLAKELGGRNILSNAIAPGFIQSDMTDVLPEKIKKEITSRIALKRLGQTRDIAETALFLAKSSYITGEVISVDGGLSI